MKIIHRYVLSQTLRNLALGLLVFTALFMVIDFFDRFDNIVGDNASALEALQYYLYKIPLTLSLMLPVAMLLATMLTLGILSKNSEVTAMRAAGMRLLWIARPVILVGLGASLFSILLNETIVPWATRREKEVYNIDIRQKDKRGTYSQSDFWWREKNVLYSAGVFDSRTRSLQNLSRFRMTSDFKVAARTDAATVDWIDSTLRWNMKHIQQYDFTPLLENPADTSQKGPLVESIPSLPIDISQKPQDFYHAKTETSAMNFAQLRKFIKNQRSSGIPVSSYLADLYAKFSFPFVCLIVPLAVLPFSIRPARSGSMAGSFLAGLIMGFAYYVVHSFSISFGRAEIWHPFMAAWAANVLLALVATVLIAGTEAP